MAGLRRQPCAAHGYVRDGQHMVHDAEPALHRAGISGEIAREALRSL